MFEKIIFNDLANQKMPCWLLLILLKILEIIKLKVFCQLTSISSANNQALFPAPGSPGGINP